MTENYGVIYRDNLEPEHAELRAWFMNCHLEDAYPSYLGQVWEIKSITTYVPESINALPEFVVEGSYLMFHD